MAAVTKQKGFSLTSDDLQLIEEIKSRARKLDISLNDVEVVRLGLAALSQLSDPQFARIVKSLRKLKPGKQTKNANELSQR